MRLYGFFGFFLGVEDHIAGGVVEPLDAEVGVDMEVVPNPLVAHVVDPKQVPGVLPKFDVVVAEVRCLLFLKELWLRK